MIMVGEGVEGQTTTNLSNHLEEKRACMVADNNFFYGNRAGRRV